MINVSVKAPQARDRKPPKQAPRRFVGHDLELTPDEMKVSAKIAWADEIADTPKMLMGRRADGRFVSLKKKRNA